MAVLPAGACLRPRPDLTGGVASQGGVARAVLDANVMVGARQRDVLLTLAEAGVYAPIWSGEILSEVGRHVPEEVSTALVREMRQAFGGF